MQPTRTIIRSPATYRIVRSPITTRSASFFPSSYPSLFSPQRGTMLPPNIFTPLTHDLTPLLPSLTHDLAPLFRLLDDFTTLASSPHHQPHLPPPQTRPLQPHFDVRETAHAYELRSDLPSLEAANLDVEFTDAQTLVIRGRTEPSARNIATAPPASTPLEAAPQTTAAKPSGAETTAAAADASDAASVRSTSSYQKPTVEDEDAPPQSNPAESTPPAPPVAATPPPPPPATAPPKQQTTAAQQPTQHTTTSFQRTFKFPTPVSHAAVTAALRDGVLRVTVPKAAAPGPRRIFVE